MYIQVKSARSRKRLLKRGMERAMEALLCQMQHHNLVPLFLPLDLDLTGYVIHKKECNASQFFDVVHLYVLKKQTGVVLKGLSLSPFVLNHLKAQFSHVCSWLTLFAIANRTNKSI